MEGKNKDKIIVGLIIAIIVLISNNYINNKKNNTSEDDNLSLLSSTANNSMDESIDTSESTDDLTESKVYITGQIKNPGVYVINQNDRLDDLIKRAGGLTDSASDKDINLAMKLEDQMKIYIPNNEEIISEDNNESSQIVYSNNQLANDGLININTANKEELMTLPNIGEKRAEAIIEYRSNNEFKNIEDIKNVTGIGEKFFQAIKDLITI